MLEKWLDYLDEQVGNGVYLWGGQGQKASEVGNIREYIARKAQDGEAALRVLRYYLALGRQDVRFFDCSGLAMYFWEDLHGVSDRDMSANGLWGVCTPLPRNEIRPGDFVFRRSDGRMAHIGYIARDGQVVEARGSGYGVEKRPLSAGGWTHFGRCGWLRAEAEQRAPAVGARTVRQWQTLLLIWDPGCLPRYGADGQYGQETDAALCALEKSLEAFRASITKEGK